MNYLMHQDDAVKNLSALDVTWLFWRDNGRQDRLESVSYYLCQKFIDDITESNGSELFWMMSLSLFGYESEESGVESLKDLSSGSWVLYNFLDLPSYHWPAVVEEIAGETVWSWSLAFGGVSQRLIHLLNGDRPK